MHEQALRIGNRHEQALRIGNRHEQALVSIGNRHDEAQSHVLHYQLINNDISASSGEKSKKMRHK